MIYGLYTSAAGMLANDYRLDVIANNLANVNTAGFKPDVPLFQQRLTERQQHGPALPSPVPVSEQLPGGLGVMPTRVNFTQGALQSTGRALDVALVGSGFLKVSQAGRIRYSRDGRLNLDPNGQLRTLSGAAVLDSEDRPIHLDRQLPVTINRDGQVRQADERVATIGLVELPRPDQISKQGDNLYAYRGAARPATDTVLEPGFIEASSADPVEQMTEMIRASRAYQANATLISYQDQTLGRAVNDVGRIA